MDRQPYCSLPWCGKTGKIDMHHNIPRSQGGSDDPSNLVALCHSCHMKHHSEERLTFDMGDVPLVLSPYSGDWEPLDVYDPVRDAQSASDEEAVAAALGDNAERTLELIDTGATVDYYLGQTLAEDLRLLHNDRALLKEWLCDARAISPRSFDSWLSKRLAYAALPEYEEVVRLGITKGYMVARLVSDGRRIEDVLSDLGSMPRSQFDAKYGLARERKKHACPDCGQVHTVKEATDE